METNSRSPANTGQRAVGFNRRDLTGQNVMGRQNRPARANKRLVTRTEFDSGGIRPNGHLEERISIHPRRRPALAGRAHLVGRIGSDGRLPVGLLLFAGTTLGRRWLRIIAKGMRCRFATRLPTMHLAGRMRDGLARRFLGNNRGGATTQHRPDEGRHHETQG